MRNIFYDDNPDIVPNKIESKDELLKSKSSKKISQQPDKENGSHAQPNKFENWKCFMEVEQAAQVRALSSFGG